MSKAFTKDEGDPGPAAPLRLPSPLPPGAKNYVTPGGLKWLRKELDRLVGKERPRIAAEASAGGERAAGPRSSEALVALDARILHLRESIESAVVVNPPSEGNRERVRFGSTVTVRVPQDARGKHDAQDAQDARGALDARGAQVVRGAQDARGALDAQDARSAQVVRGAQAQDEGDVRDADSQDSQDPRTSRYRIVGVDEADVASGAISWLSPIAKALIGAEAGDIVRVDLPSGKKNLVIVDISYD